MFTRQLHMCLTIMLTRTTCRIIVFLVCVCCVFFLCLVQSRTRWYLNEKEPASVSPLNGTYNDNNNHRIQHSASESRNKTRILCLILTYPASHDKMTAVNATWARRCDKHLFLYGRNNHTESGLNILTINVTENRRHLTSKIKSSLIHAHRRLHGFDWIVKSDDDTYVIMENLRYMLSQYDPDNPGFLGLHFRKHVKSGYMSGGAGYVISKAGLTNLVERGLTKLGECTNETGDEDVDIGRCLNDTGVPVLPSLDVQGRETFHAEPLGKYLVPPHPKWLQDYSVNKVQFGAECCSRHSISFHHLSSRDIYVYDHLLYNTTVHGQPQWVG